MLDDDLAPDVDRVGVGPPGVDLVDVDLVVDVEVLQEVEQEQRQLGVGARGHVRHRADARQPRVQLTQVELAGVDVDQVVHLEEAAVALVGQPVAEVLGEDPGARALGLVEHVEVDVVARPAALVRGELGVPGDVGHQRADERAVPREHGLDRERTAVDALHHLQLDAGQLVLRGRPGPMTRAELMKNVVLPESPHGSCTTRSVPSPPWAARSSRLVVVGDAPQHVRHARDARLVAQPRGHQLGVEPVPQRGGGQRDVDAALGGEPLGGVVDHHEHGLAARALLGGELGELGVPEQEVVHLLHRPEVVDAPLPGQEDVRVGAVEGVVVVDVVEVGDPPVDPEEVERGGRHEVDRRGVAAEVRADRGDAAQVRLAGGGGR